MLWIEAGHGEDKLSLSLSPSLPPSLRANGQTIVALQLCNHGNVLSARLHASAFSPGVASKTQIGLKASANVASQKKLCPMASGTCGILVLFVSWECRRSALGRMHTHASQPMNHFSAHLPTNPVPKQTSWCCAWFMNAHSMFLLLETRDMSCKVCIGFA